VVTEAFGELGGQVYEAKAMESVDTCFLHGKIPRRITIRHNSSQIVTIRHRDFSDAEAISRCFQYLPYAASLRDNVFYIVL